MRFAVYPYKIGSNSAHELASALDTFQIKHDRSRFRHWNNPRWWIINWGSSQCPTGRRVLNPSINVNRAADKLKFFQFIKDHARVPDFTTSRSTAAGWFNRRKDMVVCRTILSGHSGAGIVIADSPDGVVAAPLYTKYIPKDAEFRLHFISGRRDPFFVQRKVKRSDFTNRYNVRVRNLEGGYVYAHNDVELPNDVKAQAQAAFGASHLDFGAMDVIWNEVQQKAYVLEINTAPGLQGATIGAYRDAFNNLTT